MTQKARCLVLLLALVTSVPAFASRWIVRNGDGEKIHQLSMFGITQIKSLQINGDIYRVVESPESIMSVNASENVRALRQVTGAQSVTPDIPIELVEPAGANNKPRRAWHVQRMDYANLPADRDGRGVVVAVLDTGVDYNHPALKPQMWVNEGEIPGNKIDDDQNGYVDDIHGWDFAKDDADPMDESSHGTHCAGLVAALPDVTSGGEGAAPGAKIMAVRMIAGNNSTFLSDAAEAVLYAVDNGAQVLSNSWRIYASWDQFDPSEENLQLLRAAIGHAEAQGVPFVAAAGNESRDVDNITEGIFPVHFKGLSNMVIVASSDMSDRPSSFTNYGLDSVHVAAPGYDIMSTVPKGRWANKSGTSMATPIVAGLLARAFSGGLPMDQVLERMNQTAVLNKDFTGKVRSGLINPQDLLAY
ncbi:MAG: S8 family serine peptidase [Bdellovibrionales bacterium]|nr:S8 family serine peptidase [Bdellovibrionales bacterium]